MSVTIKDFTIEPHRFKNGATKKALLRYRGVLSAEEDKRVRLSFALKEEDHQVFLVDEKGRQVKAISWEETFPGRTREFTREVRFRVTEAAEETTEVETELVATSSADDSTCTAFIEYK